ncbi:MAG: aspartate aminotransferase [Epulopiscium sp. Nele67-Bin004]|nr:MAG: aspartate aminotransferase [Epulopiscium sp. Nele67-Bin004]
MISNKMQEIVAGNSMIRAMFEEGKRLAEIHGAENVYDFSLGNPNVPPPTQIIDAINNTLSSPDIHGYMNNSGFESTRTAIANSLNKRYSQSLTEKEIVMAVGAAGAINVILKSILNPNDEVIVFAPYFVEYKHYVANFDGKLVIVPPNPPSFLPDLDGLSSAINTNTKAVIINTPNNPTGVVYDSETLRQLGEVLSAKEKELGISICLISDEPYREIAYDNIDVPCVLNFYHNTFIAYSYSKSLSLPGERIGYICVNPSMVHKETVLSALNVATRILGFVNAPSLFQKVIEQLVDTEIDITFYKENRDILYNHFTSIGLECTYPAGAFYLFPKSPISDDKQFCQDAKKFNLLLVPGSGFGCPGYFRVSYCVSRNTVINSLDAFTQLMNTYKN